MWFILLWVTLLTKTLSITSKNDLFNALYLYKSRIKNIDNIKSMLSKPDTHYRRHELDKFVQDARNNYLIPEIKLNFKSRVYYSILLLPSYIDLANQILKKSDSLIKFQTQTQSNALMGSLPDTTAKMIELQFDATNSFERIKNQLTYGLPFSSVISGSLISQNSVKKYDCKNWHFLHKRACSNQLVSIVKVILSSLINKIIIPMILTALGKILKFNT